LINVYLAQELYLPREGLGIHLSAQVYPHHNQVLHGADRTGPGTPVRH
jgi:hypothetical protein